MAYQARILADSTNSLGVRLTTLEVTYPRFIHSEFMTHRMFSRNSASSRAIPVTKMIEKVKLDPAMPIFWGKNQKGMQAEIEMSDIEQQEAKQIWLSARDQAVTQAEKLNIIGAHKQIVNRILEPYIWMTVIVTATEWSNFDSLRRHKDAQPEIKKAADLMWAARQNSTPMLLEPTEYHLPLISLWELSELKQAGFDPRLVSVGRCARVSYLTHDGKRDPQADVELANRLKSSGHMSPYEHVACPMTRQEYDASLSGFSGNFRGWIQFRKTLPFESDYSLIDRV